MPSSSPLQVLVFRHPGSARVCEYEEALVRALAGGKDAGVYLANGEDLGVQLAVFGPSVDTAVPVDERLNAFCHTQIIVFLDEELVSQGTEWLWQSLEKCWASVASSHGRHGMLVLAFEERLGDWLRDRCPAMRSLQLGYTYELGERAGRPALFALRVLHECRVLLARSLAPVSGACPGFLRLFISHAKIDGLPLAQALKHQIDTLPWLKSFYDAKDLPAGCDWVDELESGVGSSLIVMLRTDIYESRYWCQQEVLWADEYAVPAVLVDARTRLQYPAGTLPLDRIPAVRIPDGNLLRVLFLSLREGLRFLLFSRRVEEMKRNGELPQAVELCVFSYAPGMAALLRACRKLASSAAPKRYILYPDPVMRNGTYEAANALVETCAPGVQLVTPHTLAAAGLP